jgi:ABC-2 type transport system permease protein
MKYTKLLAVFLKSSLLVDLEYRANFVVQAFMGVFQAGITYLSVALFFTHTDNLGGWSYEQSLVIVGMFSLINGVIFTFMQPNIKRIVEMVRDGTMDFVLTKPVNSQFMATLRHIKFSGFSDVIAGSAIIVFALSRMGYVPDAASLAAFALMLVIAIVIVYSIWLVMGATAFWFVKIDNLAELFNTLFDTARFPITTFSGIMRIFLTFVLPVAFITTVPARAILGQLDWLTVAGALLMGAALFIAGSLFWRYTVRSYTSASS